MENSTVRKVQLCQIDMAIELKRICQKYNIKYFMTGGTLKGAVLNKGFLIGDCDIDIGMPRYDYERFIKICQYEFSEEYYIQNNHTEQKFPFLYSKMRIKGTEFIEFNSKNADIDKGIFIDIYPFDTMPDNYLQKTIQLTKHKFFKGLLMKRNGFITGHENIVVNSIFKLINKFISGQQIYYMAEKNIKKYNNRNYGYIYAFEGGHGYAEHLNKKSLENMVEIEFENENFNAPSDYRSFLTNIYGDQAFSGSEKKDGHNIIKVSFGKYFPKCIGGKYE